MHASCTRHMVHSTQYAPRHAYAPPDTRLHPRHTPSLHCTTPGAATLGYTPYTTPRHAYALARYAARRRARRARPTLGPSPRLVVRREGRREGPGARLEFSPGPRRGCRGREVPALPRVCGLLPGAAPVPAGACGTLYYSGACGTLYYSGACGTLYYSGACGTLYYSGACGTLPQACCSSTRYTHACGIPCTVYLVVPCSSVSLEVHAVYTRLRHTALPAAARLRYSAHVYAAAPACGILHCFSLRRLPLLSADGDRNAELSIILYIACSRSCRQPAAGAGGTRVPRRASEPAGTDPDLGPHLRNGEATSLAMESGSGGGRGEAIRKIYYSASVAEESGRPCPTARDATAGGPVDPYTHPPGCSLRTRVARHVSSVAQPMEIEVSSVAKPRAADASRRQRTRCALYGVHYKAYTIRRTL
jgi:hypothetical protein